MPGARPGINHRFNGILMEQIDIHAPPADSITILS
jgi:hypothetical protein